MIIDSKLNDFLAKVGMTAIVTTAGYICYKFGYNKGKKDNEKDTNEEQP